MIKNKLIINWRINLEKIRPTHHLENDNIFEIFFNNYKKIF